MPGVPEKFPAKVTDGEREYEVHDPTAFINAVFGRGHRPVPDHPEPPAPAPDPRPAPQSIPTATAAATTAAVTEAAAAAKPATPNPVPTEGKSK